MKLSIIVPIYNAEKYLHRCINSLLSQGMADGEYEIILINDGSTDNSLSIANEFKEKHERTIKVLSHDNKGVAYTRNRGINEAKGEYLCFVDADDYLIPNGYKYLIDNHLKEATDVLSFWSITLDKKTKANYTENYNVKGELCYEKKGREFLQNGIQTFCFCSLYKRSFILDNKISFTELIIGEDVLFNLDLYMKNPTIRMISSSIYRYDLHETSAIHRRDYPSIRKAIASYKTLIFRIKEYIMENNNDSLLCNGLENTIGNQFVPFVSRLLSSDFTYKELTQLKNELQTKGIFPLKGKGIVQFVINTIFRTPIFIGLYEKIYQHIFLTFIFPYLSRN